MDRIQRLFAGGMGGAGGPPPSDTPQVDTAEQVIIPLHVSSIVALFLSSSFSVHSLPTVSDLHLISGAAKNVEARWVGVAVQVQALPCPASGGRNQLARLHLF